VYVTAVGGTRAVSIGNISIVRERERESERERVRERERKSERDRTIERDSAKHATTTTQAK